MAKIEWNLLCGEFDKNIKADENDIPVNIATLLIEKNFNKLFKKNKKTVAVGIIAVLSNATTSYIFPADLLFANAGLYNHAEVLKKTREKLFNETK